MTSAVATAAQQTIINTNNNINSNNINGSSSSSQTTTTTSTNNNNTASATSNRLNFNRLANERKTVHVMNNKDMTKNSKYSAAGMQPNLASNNYSAIASGINNQHNNLNGPSSTLDSHSSGGGGIGRNQTNATGSFLQKLSSKFTRR
jgi:hypothetical protein